MATARQTMKDMEIAKLNLLRESAWDDLYIFSKYVCGFDLMEEEPHLEVCEVLTHGIELSAQLNLNCRPPLSTDFVKNNTAKLKKLLMLPRGSFKSTVATTTFPIWLLWHNPNLRIMIDSETLSNAKMYLAGIKDMIDNNPLLRKICVNDKGEYLLEPNRRIAGGWTEEQIFLKHRTILGRKEPTIFCSGADNARTGMHPDVIIMDDMVSERNVGTADQIEKVKNHYRFSLSLLEPDGLQVVIGTRYHMADLYGDLLEMRTFECYVRPARLGYTDLGEWILFFPNRLTQEFLEEKRAEQGSYIFSSQYMLSPLDDSSATFKQAYIKYYDRLPREKIVEKYILIDLAISQKQRADFTVIMTVGVTSDKDIYIIDYDRGKYLPKETISRLFDMYKFQNRDGKVRVVGIETVSFQKSMIYFIKDEMLRLGIRMPLKELKADLDKKRRIGALEPLFEQGKVFMKREHVELEQELIEFPFSKHDDAADALAYVLQILRAGNSYRKNKRKEYKIKNKILGY